MQWNELGQISVCLTYHAYPKRGRIDKAGYSASEGAIVFQSPTILLRQQTPPFTTII